MSPTPPHDIVTAWIRFLTLVVLTWIGSSLATLEPAAPPAHAAGNEHIERTLAAMERLLEQRSSAPRSRAEPDSRRFSDLASELPKPTDIYSTQNGHEAWMWKSDRKSFSLVFRADYVTGVH